MKKVYDEALKKVHANSPANLDLIKTNSTDLKKLQTEKEKLLEPHINLK